MNRPGLHFERLEVRRAGGIELGQGFTLSPFSSQVNLIHGPNGSGKSTTLRMIQALLWPGKSDLSRPSALAEYHLTGQEGQAADAKWRVELDAGHAQVQENGRPIALPDHGPADARSRYRLALDELIVDDNRDFAKIIADASQGGFDLAEAEIKLDFADTPRSPRKLVDALKNARAVLRNAKANQGEIDQQVRETDELKHQLAQANQARQQLALHAKAREFHEHSLMLSHLNEQLQQFPKAMSLLRGDENVVLQQLEERRGKLQQERSKLRDQMEGANKQREKLAWAASTDDAPLDEAHHLALRLQQIETRLESQQSPLIEKQHLAKGHLDRLSTLLREEYIPSLLHISLKDMNNLTELAGEVDQLRAAQAMHTAHRERLTRNAQPITQSVDQLQSGLVTLGHWLASPPPAPMPITTRPTLWPWWVMIVVLVVLSVIMVMTSMAMLLILTLPLVGLAVWQIFQGRQTSGQHTPAADPRQTHQQLYGRTDLPQPLKWDAAAVTALIQQLQRLMMDRQAEDRRQDDLSEVTREQTALLPRQEKIEQCRQELETRLGLKIDLTDHWLSRLVAAITQWQQSHLAAIAAEKTREETIEQAATLRQELGRALAVYDVVSIPHAVAAQNVIAELRSRLHQWRIVNEQLVNDQRRVEAIEDTFRNQVQEQKTIYARLGIDPMPNIAAVDQLLVQWKSYKQLHQKYQVERSVVEHLRTSLQNESELLESDPTEIENAIVQLQQSAAGADELAQRIGSATQMLDQARRGHQIADATQAVDDAESKLLEARQEAQASLTGHLLTQWVRHVAVEQTRPQVFARANELLVHITRGALTLDLDDRDAEPHFLARQGHGAWRPVNELSVGERVQLLLAVRIAFLEHQETTQLPLLLDETLGTSDDTRAGLIIDAMIQLAKQGRQIFYFTAQLDEVGKWVARLQAEGVDHRIMDLGQLRHLRHADDQPLAIASIEPVAPPSPAGLSRQAYGELLKVPSLNFMEDRQDQVHLWHLTEDMTLLHQLLSLSIVRWGALQTLLEHQGGDILPKQDPAVWHRMTLAAKMLGKAMELWRIGRGRIVERETLPGPLKIADGLAEQLIQLSRDCQGDASKILAALEDKQIRHWRQNNTDTLRAYFEEGGYLPVETPVSAEEIRLRLMAMDAQSPETSRPSQSWQRGLMDQINALCLNANQ